MAKATVKAKKNRSEKDDSLTAEQRNELRIERRVERRKKRLKRINNMKVVIGGEEKEISETSAYLLDMLIDDEDV